MIRKVGMELKKVKVKGMDMEQVGKDMELKNYMGKDMGQVGIDQKEEVGIDQIGIDQEEEGIDQMGIDQEEAGIEQEVDGGKGKCSGMDNMVVKNHGCPSLAKFWSFFFSQKLNQKLAMYQFDI